MFILIFSPGKQIGTPSGTRVFDLMAPRRSNQEGEAPAGFMEEQVANIEHGQVSEAVVENNGRAEILPTATPGGDIGEAVVVLRQMMEENRKLVAKNCQAIKENRQMMVENLRMMEEAISVFHQADLFFIKQTLKWIVSILV
ncbi:unnamed protein product [Linum trigynum]|uniref:Uncharacterized protein n=1 Tax=Linum trigynum TaxID=586398 RepID=A0AAV2GBW9_9ROSI